MKIIDVASGSIISVLFMMTVISASGQESGRACLWGTDTEITTYQPPYNPILAKEIPVLDSPGKKKMTPIDANAVSPETAIMVRTSDGKCYAYYYKYMLKRRLRVVGAPSQTDTCPAADGSGDSGAPCSFAFAPRTGDNYPGPYFTNPGENGPRYYYETVRVRVKVIISCPDGAGAIPGITPAPVPGAVGPATPVPLPPVSSGGTSVQFQTQVQ